MADQKQEKVKKEDWQGFVKVFRMLKDWRDELGNPDQVTDETPFIHRQPASLYVN